MKGGNKEPLRGEEEKTHEQWLEKRRDNAKINELGIKGC
jgi:hypothetical protein